MHAPHEMLTTLKRSVPFDADEDRVEDLVRREFQTCIVRSLNISPGRTEIEVQCPRFSEIIATLSCGSVPVIEVWHHSAVLLPWLEHAVGDNQPVVVHFDSHSDLGSPNLVCDGTGKLFDRWTGRPLCASLPQSVQSAIDSSAIEIGSYLTAALLLLPIQGIAWFRPPVDDRPPCQPMVTGLSLEWSQCDALDSSLCRLRAARGGPRQDRWYLESDIVPRGLSELVQSNIIIDIDLDYFDNSDHRQHWRRSSLSANGRMELFREILRCIDPAGVVAVSIARSPGFCPAPVAARLSTEVKGILESWLKRP